MKTALIVIDVQKIYTDPDSEMFCEDSKATVTRINNLIENFRKNGSPIYYVRHVHKLDGSDTGHLFDFDGEAEEDFNFKEGSSEVEYDGALIRAEDSIEFVKTRYSAFANSKLNEQLKEDGVKRVVICGFMTNFCCESTARNALDFDYYVDFIIDATGTPGTENMDENEIRKVVGELMESGFARVLSTDEYIH